MRYDINPRNYLNILTSAIWNKEECSYSGISDCEVVLKGKNEINLDYCIKNKILTDDTPNEGGCIVLQSGDIEFGFFKFDGFEDGSKVILEIKDFLKDKGLDIDVVGNDLIVEGKYKVGSYSSVNVGDRLIYSGFHISMSVNLEHIKNICLKPMVKIPKGLSEYGIDVNELYDFIVGVLDGREDKDFD